jgi:hypothetical protein
MADRANAGHLLWRYDAMPLFCYRRARDLLLKVNAPGPLPPAGPN